MVSRPRSLVDPVVFNDLRALGLRDRPGRLRHPDRRPVLDLAGRCVSPVFREAYSPKTTAPLRTNANGIATLDARQVRSVEMWVRCRKCPNCLLAKASHWRNRIAAEIALSNRTWFGTMTLSPESHSSILNHARHRARQRGLGDLDAQPEADRIRYELAPLIREWQLFMKRVRKQGARVRFFLVVERHKSGLPHLHCLLHEIGEPVRHRQLTSNWRLGFTNFKLVAEHKENLAARYVTKYVTKDTSSRVRASLGYGCVS